jgi:glyceraldehyde 3-phosphate dehydrogenase
VIGDLVKVVAWYDNEWGYAHSLVEITSYVGQHLPADEPQPSPLPQTVHG